MRPFCCAKASAGSLQARFRSIADARAVHVIPSGVNEIGSDAPCHPCPSQPPAFDGSRFRPHAGVRHVDGLAAGGSDSAGGWRAGVKVHLLNGCALNERAETDRNHLQFHVASAFLRLADYVGCAVLACNGGCGDSASGVLRREWHASEALLRPSSASRVKCGHMHTYGQCVHLLWYRVDQCCPVVPKARRYGRKNHVSLVQLSYTNLAW